MLLKLAWRNIWRHKRRSLITSLSIAFGFWLAAFFTGIANYSYTSMINDGSSMGYGHISIIPEGYLDSPSPKKTVSEASRWLNQFKGYDQLSHITPRIIGQGIVATASKNIATQFTAIDPKRENKETNFLLRSISEGELFPDSNSRSCIIGSKMAKKLKLKLNKKLVLTTTDRNGEIVSSLFRVKGIVTTGSDDIDSYSILLPLGRMQKLLGYSPEEVTLISLQLKDQRKSNSIRNSLKTHIKKPTTTIKIWSETQKELAGFVAVDRGTTRIFLGFVAFLVAIGVLNTILMSILERKREFGILLAIGMKPGSLINSILMESLFITLVGVMIGSAITVPFHYYFKYVGFDISEYIGEGVTAGGAVFEPMMRSLLYPIDILVITCGLAILSLLAALYPAVKAGRFPPAQSIKDL